MHEEEIVWTSPQGELQKPRSTADMELALRAALEARATGRIPPIEEIAEKPLWWLRDVNLQLKWLEYHENLLKTGQGQATNGNGNGLH